MTIRNTRARVKSTRTRVLLLTMQGVTYLFEVGESCGQVYKNLEENVFISKIYT